MIRKLLILAVLNTVLFGQSSYDILGVPTTAKDAALGINLNPIVRPTAISSSEDRVVTLNGWSWIADIQSAYLGVDLANMHVGVRSVNFGEFEYRNEIPSDDPISTFGYSLFSIGGAYAYELNSFIIGLGAELVYERTLNASATGLSLNLAAAYPVSDNLGISTGLRHLGTTEELDTAATALPTEIWFGADLQLNEFSVLTELSSGVYPLALGVSYRFADIFDVMGGLQVELADPSVRMHPSLGFSVDWTNFTLGYTNYQMNHRLGSRHFFSLYWRY